MNFIGKSIFRKLIRQSEGQALVWTMISLTTMLGVSGVALDAGHGYYAYQRLKTATNAATLAGAAGMPNTTTATANVAAYSSATGSKNFLGSIMTNVVATPSFACSTTVTNQLNTPCVTATGGSGGYNSVKVQQCATVPTWFGQLFGVKQFNICANSMAAMAGGANTPYNVAIILDTTASMASSDSGKQCSGTQISCALKGVQKLLTLMTPCGANVTTCTSSSTPVDAVSLFVFPPILTTTAKNDYTCPSSNPTHEWYTVPTLPSTWTYQLPLGTTSTPDPWSSDYKSTAGASTLNSSSQVVIAAGGGGCSGVQAPGGAGTYYAQVIYMAQAQLAAEAAANKGSKNAMIILTDGDATSTTDYTGSGKTAVFKSDSQLLPSTAGSLNGITGNNPTSPTYPSAVGMCGQAVVAAKAAADAGTTVFTFAYGAPTSGGCTSDKNYSTSITTNGGSWGPGGQPCAAIAAMASSTSNFYSDDAQGCAATNSYNAQITNLQTMFSNAWSSLTQPRLIPNNTN